MTAEEFNEAFALSQFLPGPNVVNLSVVFGSRLRGASGAVVALPDSWSAGRSSSCSGMLYARYGDLDAVRRVLTGIASAAAGLIIATVAKMAEPLFRSIAPAPFLLVATFVAIGLLRWPLFAVLAVLVPVSIAIAWWWVRR